MSWDWVQIELPTPALLKRIRVDVIGNAKGYLAVFAEGMQPAYYAGTAPHLTRYTSERAARRHAIPLPSDAVWTLPEEALCQFVKLCHIAVEGEYSVRGFSPVLLNPLPTEEEPSL